jgi:hypothetical protein
MRSLNLGLGMLMLLWGASVRADPPLLLTTTAFLPPALLEALAKEAMGTAKVQNRVLDQPGWRLRLACDQHPLPPDWMAGAKKALFSWTCLVAWERKVQVVTADTWAVESETLITGTTDGDQTAIKTTLRQRLYDFLQLKPPAGN